MANAEIKKHLNSLFRFDFNRVHILEDGTVNINGDVHCKAGIKIPKLPIKFGKVKSFECMNVGLTSLENCPNFVLEDFKARRNQITSMQGCPDVNGDLDLSDNPITNMDGICMTAKSISITYNENLPVLRLLFFDKVYMTGNIPIARIIDKHRKTMEKLSKKAVILNCQKELIENGFINNAKL
jgi:hypothetical protein